MTSDGKDDFFSDRLLIDLFKTPSPSGHEDRVRELIKRRLRLLNISYRQDRVGNLYNVNFRNMPVLSAHMDTVQGFHDIQKLGYIHFDKDYIFGQGVIGADDKCGIYIILKILETRPVNFIFTVEEEVGALGMQHFISQNTLKHVLYGLILDRRNDGDIICVANSYGTEKFENDIARIGKAFGYEPAIGLFSDADYLKKRMSCANLSVGYYNAHSFEEFVVLKEMENAYHYTKTILNKIKKRYKPPKEDLFFDYF